MSSRDIIENKISYILKQLEILRSYQKHSLDDMSGDIMLLGGLKWELYVMSQATIDLAEAVVAFKQFRKPTTMREAFDILAEQEILPVEFVHRFAKMVGFRNALAHDYEDLKIEVLYDVLMNKLAEVEEFIGYIKTALGI